MISTKMSSRFLKMAAVLFAGTAGMIHADTPQSRFFRVDPYEASSSIVSISSRGQMAWSNAHPTGHFQVQWSGNLAGGEWRDYVSGTRTGTWQSVKLFDPASPPGMVLVPAGDFAMGDMWGGDWTARPVHAVLVSAIYVDRHTVSKALWDEVRAWGLTNGFSDLAIGKGGGRGVASIATNGGVVTTNWLNFEAGPAHPVVEMDWYDAVKWCNARSLKDGLEPAYYLDGGFATLYRTGKVDLANSQVNWSATGYRLPTEAEWEKAARGGLVQNHYAWPSTGLVLQAVIDGTMANYWGSGDAYDQGTTPAGYYNGSQVVINASGERLPAPNMANAYGLYDMVGNVWEFCWDLHSSTTYQWRVDSGNLVDPRGPTYVDAPLRRVDRGGSWRTSTNSLNDLRVGVRYWVFPADASANLNRGFRTVRRALDP
jgi:formylglycine-generating enzyme required for sulfatase activity